jgi:diaminopimelate epimerase
MVLHFSKFHGAGNDFVMVDNRDGQYSLSQEQIHFLCQQHLGIGADGLILLQNSNVDNVDFSMKYYNSDGFEGTMCGNGGRCITAFAALQGIDKKSFTFDAIDGLHYSEILAMDSKLGFDIKLQMKPVSAIQELDEYYLLDTGSPHLVVFVDNAKNADVVGMGKMLRYDRNITENGTNVDFVSYKKGRLFVRTYERGVENETLSCGTGITASAIAIAKKLDLPFESIAIDALGGAFEVSFHHIGQEFRNIWLRGPVTRVFDGTIEL